MAKPMDTQPAGTAAVVPASDPRWMLDAELLAELDAAFARRRQVDAVIVRLSGELVERSRPSLGATGLATRLGDSSPAATVTRIGRIPLAEASRICRVGDATAERVSLVGERMPASFPVVASAVDAAEIPTESALAIVSALAQTTPRADRSDLDAAELALVDFARDNPADIVRKLAIAWRDALDADGIEPREEALVAKRSAKRFALRNGLKRYLLDLDPASAAYLDAWIDGYVGNVIRAPRMTEASASHGGEIATDACNDEHEELPDPRTLTQISADAIVELAKHGIGCTKTEAPMSATTVVVRMSLDSLLTGLGQAQIDGGEEPISAATARRLAADAGIIPMVLGGNSEVLDLGVSRRLFSRAQRIAFAERDGGCAWRNCPRPPSYTEAHHIAWWSAGGRSDLDNGALLCSRHHHLIHSHRWRIEVIDNVPWFIPPSSVDIYRTPRQGGRLPAPVPHASAPGR